LTDDGHTAPDCNEHYRWEKPLVSENGPHAASDDSNNASSRGTLFD